jgi:hypothetical protein
MAAKKSTAKSKLSAATNAKRNTKAGRAKMAPASFALPAQKKYRIDDAAHARNALGRAAQNGTPAEQAQVSRAVAKKYPRINVTGLSKKRS